MPSIQQLPPSVITKIAAGEVIERPASVLKELLENSVDAGSTRIDVDVEQGGVELIRVVDNGCGIPAEELPLAFASHATSKLASADDLFRIGTLGFRGEALASMGSVAQVMLQSRTAGESCGAEMSCRGGGLSSLKAWNGGTGTRLEVRHLFFNTPVRRKFMRAIPTEMGHLSEQFTRLALSHPEISWTLRHNGKLTYELPAGMPFPERIRLFFGKEISDHLFTLEAKQGAVALRGWIADPSCERGTAKMQYLFLNGRWIRDRSLGHALQEGYRGLLMGGRYAVAFLFLDLPPDQVDVNVHPTKAEVRFRDGNALHHLVHAAIRERLRAENLTPRLQVPSTTLGGLSTQSTSMFRLQAQAPATSLPFTSSFLPDPPSGYRTRIPEPQPSPEPQPEVAGSGRSIEQLAGLLGQDGEKSGSGSGGDLVSGGGSGSALPPAGSFKAIQLYDTYLVLETDEGMLVIDQHALHERILFEALKERLRSGPLETQRLLIPDLVELAAEAAARTLECRDELAQLGLEVGDFGGGTVLLSSYPAILGRRPPQEILQAVVDHLVSMDRPPSREVLLNDLLSLMACHAAVRAGDRLTADEIEALVAQRSMADNTHHCPHGRPTALLFSRHELERQFRRL
ncbi:MAG: DNA mismatch repair endonuclease MutL [Gemmataceae bacterium]